MSDRFSLDVFKDRMERLHVPIYQVAVDPSLPKYYTSYFEQNESMYPVAHGFFPHASNASFVLSLDEQTVIAQATLLSKLTDVPGVPRILGACSKTPGIMLSYYPPMSFKNMLTRQYSDPILLEVLRSLSETVLALHNEGFVHNNINENSVRVTIEGSQVQTTLVELGRLIRYGKEPQFADPTRALCLNCMKIAWEKQRPLGLYAGGNNHPQTDIKALGKLVDAVLKKMHKKPKPLKKWVKSSKGKFGTRGCIEALIDAIDYVTREKGNLLKRMFRGKQRGCCTIS